MPKLECEKPSISVLEMANRAFDEVEQDNGLRISELADLDFGRCLIEVNPGIEKVVDPNCERVF